MYYKFKLNLKETKRLFLSHFLLLLQSVLFEAEEKLANVLNKKIGNHLSLLTLGS